MVDKKRHTYRKEGYLKTMNQQGTPKHIFTFDTETYIIDKGEHGIEFPFRLGYIEYTRLDDSGQIKIQEGAYISSGKEMMHFIEKRLGVRDKAYIFAHNIGFDLRVLELFTELDKRGYTSEPPILNDLVFIWIAKKAKQSLVFMDTSNLGVRSVKSLGKDMGFDKLEVEFDNVSDDDLRIYCKRDVQILTKFVTSYIQFLREHSLGNFKLTLAGQALQAYRTAFNKEDIFIHMDYGAIRIERDAYYGGRTECFKLGYIGEQKYYYLDVNSMYPYVMAECEIPTKLIGRIKNPKIQDIIEHDDYYIIADVTLDTNDNAYPLRLTNVPETYNLLDNPDNIEEYPNRSSNRLIFPTGVFRTTLHDVEIRHAIKNDDIVSIHRLYVYEKGTPFREYVLFFYELKRMYTETTNPTMRMMAKLFLNTLYGKFGQLLSHRDKLEYESDIDIARETVHVKSTGFNYQLLYWFKRIYKEFKQGETAFSSPAIAGAITAYARYTMYKFYSIAGKKNTYYTDTDSLMTNQEGYDNLRDYLSDYELGKLSLEHTSRRLIIRGNKDYRFDGVRKFKGLPNKAQKIAQNKWAYIQFTGFITWLNGGGIGGMRGKHSFKSRRSDYNKGIVLDDGSILPYHLNEHHQVTNTDV